MFFKKYTLTFLTIGVASVNAFTGKATLDSTVDTVSCGFCPPSGIPGGVGVPLDKITDHRASCCATVALAYEGHNIQGRITAICPSCLGSENITLNALLFRQLGVDPAVVKEIEPVVWNVQG
ncbi:hypothetical protein L218DRAFT_1074891 [Marasmius fiardii PR-910]|nr:hypothetical protein L218DRAFT_1074891 [Marasmius fiardii PR-910]